MTLYELRSGRLPFESDNVLDLLRQAAEEEARPLDGELGTIAAKAMEKEPGRRYGAASELADDLERWLTGESIQARRASVVYRVKKKLLKRKAVVAALALAVTLAFLTVPPLLRARRFNAAYEAATGKVNDFTLAVSAASARQHDIGRKAVQALEAALAIDDRRPAAWTWLGRCRKILGGDSRDCWDRALRAEPRNAEALLERGRQQLEEYQMTRGEPEIGYSYFGSPLHVRGVQGETPDQAARRERGQRDLDAARRAGVPGHLAGRFSEAEPCFARAIEEGANVTEVFRVHGFLFAFAGRTSEALARLRKACELVLPHHPRDIAVDYPKLRIGVLRCRLGERAAAAGELRAHLKERGKDDGYAKMAAFVAGDLPEADFLKAAESPSDEKARNEQACEASFYVGMIRLFGGDEPGARRFLQQCVATGVTNYLEYQGAEAELRRLKK